MVFIQERSSKEPHWNSAFTSCPSEITKHITNHCMRGSTFPSLAPFLFSLRKSNSAIFIKIFFFPPCSKFSLAFPALIQQEQPCTSCEPQPTSQAAQDSNPSA